MIYNKIHNRYDLPLGLQFSLHFNKVEYPDKWVSLSNIPALDHFVFEGIDNEQEILEIIRWIFNNLEIYLDNEVIEELLETHNLDIAQIKLINQIIAKYNNQQYTINKPLNEVYRYNSYYR